VSELRHDERVLVSRPGRYLPRASADSVRPTSGVDMAAKVERLAAAFDDLVASGVDYASVYLVPSDDVVDLRGRVREVQLRSGSIRVVLHARPSRTPGVFAVVFLGAVSLAAAISGISALLWIASS